MPLLTLQTNGTIQPGLSREWLLTNGSGAFAGSTIVGCNTRRYHGLLVAALRPPVGRNVMLSRVGEIVTFADTGAVHELSVNQFGEGFHPLGYQYLQRFDLIDYLAEWTYNVQGVEILKTLQLHRGLNEITLDYVIDPKGRALKFEVLPFLAMRDFHSLRHGTDGQFKISSASDGFDVSVDSLGMSVGCSNATWKDQPDWWRGHEYALEAERGQDHTEELFNPGRFVAQVDKRLTVSLRAAAGENSGPTASSLSKLISTGSVVVEGGESAPKPRVKESRTIATLKRAADQFVVARTNPDGSAGRTVIAGYPWFSDWGRDTMISLPGLLLCSKRFAEARDVLQVFAEYVSEGMIPNRFNDYSNEPEYNTVDASLWFINACFDYLRTSNDRETFENDLLPACHRIIDGYSAGTRYGIALDAADGLITQGDASTQLTWMDAKMGDIAFTPRQGKAVEINALWYNALVLLQRDELAAQVKASFAKAYWNSADAGLFDVVLRGERDGKIRPNQIFAVSLPNSPLTIEQQSAVVNVVQRELLTPYGLRTLSPTDPDFRPFYRGNQFDRDGAYHNGTIWPWLIGPFLEAYLKVNRSSPASIAQAKQWLAPLLDALQTQGCLGQLAEIYEAQPPHRPVGCYAQAWSIAEVLRIGLILGL